MTLAAVAGASTTLPARGQRSSDCSAVPYKSDVPQNLPHTAEAAVTPDEAWQFGETRSSSLS